MSDLKHFERQLPPLFLSLLETLGKHGYVVTVVGGIVRDFFLTGQIKNDWDLEITHPTLAWELGSWKDLGKELTKVGRVSYLPYDVIRVEGGELEFELSPPRRETFTEENHHKNFVVEFDFRLPFEEAIKRRDFTINTMGIRFSQKGKGEFLDPLNGLLHLRGKELCPVGSDFTRDPVRFLRAIRFSVRLDFHFSPELTEAMKKMNLSSLTPSYLWSEMQKSGHPLKFYERCLNEHLRHPEFRLPTGPLEGKIELLEKVLKDPSRHESWIIALEWEEIPSAGWQKFFQLPLDHAKRLERWAKLTKEFAKVLPETFHGEFEVVRDKPGFETLFDWYFTTKHLLQKNPDLPILTMIESYLPNWIHLYRFEVVKDVKHIDPPFRAKYQVWNLCQRL